MTLNLFATLFISKKNKFVKKKKDSKNKNEIPCRCYVHCYWSFWQ